MAKGDDAKKNPAAAAASGPDAAEIANPSSTGPAPRADESMLRFLIELAVNEELRAKFTRSPRSAINDVSPDMSEEEKQAIIDRNSVGIRDLLNAIPLQHGMEAARDMSSAERVRSQSSAKPSGTGGGRRRVVRVEVEFED
jgi:hypothetical protein